MGRDSILKKQGKDNRLGSCNRNQFSKSQWSRIISIISRLKLISMIHFRDRPLGLWWGQCHGPVARWTRSFGITNISRISSRKRRRRKVPTITRDTNGPIRNNSTLPKSLCPSRLKLLPVRISWLQDLLEPVHITNILTKLEPVTLLRLLQCSWIRSLTPISGHPSLGSTNSFSIKNLVQEAPRKSNGRKWGHALLSKGRETPTNLNSTPLWDLSKECKNHKSTLIRPPSVNPKKTIDNRAWADPESHSPISTPNWIGVKASALTTTKWRLSTDSQPTRRRDSGTKITRKIMMLRIEWHGARREGWLRSRKTNIKRCLVRN